MSAVIRETIRANHDPAEANEIARMQSLLTRGGRVASVGEAKRALRKLSPARLPSGIAEKLPAPVGRCDQAVYPSGKQALISTRCPAYPGEDLT